MRTEKWLLLSASALLLQAFYAFPTQNYGRADLVRFLFVLASAQGAASALLIVAMAFSRSLRQQKFGVIAFALTLAGCGVWTMTIVVSMISV